MERYGYTDTSVDGAIEWLRMRLASGDGFPHEIGLFLGYPVEDVLGFIENAGQNCKCCGCWKVYCNEAPDDEADAACIALGKKLAGE